MKVFVVIAAIVAAVSGQYGASTGKGANQNYGSNAAGTGKGAAQGYGAPVASTNRPLASNNGYVPPPTQPVISSANTYAQSTSNNAGYGNPAQRPAVNQNYGQLQGSKAGMPYNFQWAVQDLPSLNDFNHQESSDGNLATGSYRVALPDGRTQIVTYRVEGDSGYVAEVRYEGEARYDNVQTTGNNRYNSNNNNNYNTQANNYNAQNTQVAANVQSYSATGNGLAYGAGTQQANTGYGAPVANTYAQQSVKTPSANRY